ncbi:MAG: neutral zinc metallopeptidase, partial [Gemmatimonadetes bacterium]|nr:neutral zinc metallopeptidase [Gemmatimonadota bacterium]
LTTPRLSGDGARVRTDAPSLEPTPRRARLPEMAIGVVLMVGFSLAAVLWHMNATDKVPALALASNVARGEVIEPGDLDEAVNAASAIGDDKLQQQGQGYVVPESFTHGSSAQRMAWFRRGHESGQVSQCDTFATNI